MTTKRRGLGRRASWIAVLSLIVGALVAPSAVSAHSLKVTLTCQDGLKVNFSSYNASSGHTNTVAVSIDGSPVAGSPFTFGTTFSQTWIVAPPSAPHTATVTVTAWDDPTGSKGWTKTFNLSIDACVQATPSPTPTATQTPTPAPGEATPTPIATPSGGVGGATGTPATTAGATLPNTDTLDGATQAPAGDAWRLILLALAGVLTAVLLLTRTRAVVRRDDRNR